MRTRSIALGIGFLLLGAITLAGVTSLGTVVGLLWVGLALLWFFEAWRAHRKLEQQRGT